MPLTVLTYNIRNGAEPDRLDRVLRVVTAHHPDILALQELRHFDTDGGRRLGTVAAATKRGPLTVIGTHLNPYSGWRRRWEARWLAGRVRRERLALVMGDLNTLDPWTDHTERLRALDPQFRGRHLRRGTVDTRAVAVLAEAGLVDLFRRAGDPAGPDHTAPTTDGGGTEFSRMRLDYVLGTPGIAELTRDCRIISGGDAENASDHYPVLAEFDLSLD